MANTVIAFDIQVDGTTTLNELSKKIKETKDSMKDLGTTTQEYAEAAKKLAKLKAEQSALKKQQDDLNKSFIEQSSAIGTYDQLSAKLNRLRKDYKDLAVAEQENTDEAKALLNEITDLDQKLKKVDATVGQFQRNVGNYPVPDYSDIISNLNKLQAEYNQLSDEQKQNSQEAKELANQIDRLNKEVVDITSSYDKLSAENNKLKKRYKDLAVQNKLNTDEAKALKKQIDELDNTLKKSDKTLEGSTKKAAEFPKVFNLAGRGLRRYAGVLEDTEGKLSGFSIAIIGAFAAFKAASAIIKVIGDINQFNKELDRTEQQLKSLTGVSGEELEGLQTNITALSKTFDVDSKTIIDSAKQISEKTGVSFQDAIGQIENGLLKGNESADAFLSGISEFPDAYADASQASGEFADKQKELLESNRDFAESQAEGARKFEEVGFVIEKLGKQLQVFLIDAFLYFYNNVLTPLYDNSIKPLIQAFENLFSQIGGGGVVLQGLTKIIQLAQLPLTSLLYALTQITNAFAEMIKYARQAGEYLGIISKQTQTATTSTKDYFAETTKGITETFKMAQEYEAKRDKAEKDAIEKKKKQQEAIKQANEEAKRQQEQISKDRKKFLDDEAKYTEAALKVNKSIIDKTNKIVTDLIADEYLKRRELARKNVDDEIADLQFSIDEQKKANIERIAEAEKLFGAESKQAKKARSEAEKNEMESAEQLATFEKNLRIKLVDELIEIDKDQTNKLIEENNKYYDKKQKQSEQNFENEKNMLDAQLAYETKGLDDNNKKRLTAEQKYSQQLFDLEKKRIEEQIKLNLEQLNQNKDLTKDQVSEILSQNIALNTDLAKLENERTNIVKNEVKKRSEINEAEAEKRRQQLQEDLDMAAEFTQFALDTLNSFAQASDEKRLNRIEKDEEANQEALDNLQNRLQTATGLERRYLEQQIAQEKQKAEQLAKDKEKVEKQAAKREKAVALIQSIINTALAITKALPDPITATIAAVVGAAQTAVIAAQPLAKGGVVGKGDEVVQFANGGVVTNKGNIKPLSNGDNVLATLKTGEIVLNKSQQNKIGYATLKKAQIPNFANGGVVGAPTSLITSANNSIATEQMKTDLMQSLIESTNNRIDRLSVVYTATTDYQVEQSRLDKKTIKTNSTF